MRPVKVRLRAYNVGFGDCFLMTVKYEDDSERHVLIDFGSTKLPTEGPKSMRAVAEKIAQHSGGKLQMVAVTHRHADHMSGFAGTSGDVIRGLDPDLVVQPWTEHPDLDPKATAPAGPGSMNAAGHRTSAAARDTVALLGEMSALARDVSARGQHLAATGRGPKTIAQEISFLGETNIKNENAVRNLMTLGKRRVYANFGTHLPLASVLPGVKVEVLGPPTLEQAPGIAQMRSKDAVEYWHLAARMAEGGGAGQTSPLFPRARKARIPQSARWLVPQIDRMNAEELLSLVRIIDDVLNNTSLILLFDIGGILLLFAGDAQFENWSYALFDAPNRVALGKRLADVALYKVGHHGSLNGTPKTMWNRFAHLRGKSSSRILKTLLSTAGSVHGKPWRGTEVPRKILVTELEEESELTSTQGMRAVKTFWKDVVLDIPAN